MNPKAKFDKNANDTINNTAQSQTYYGYID